ncbi:hypothetical protein QAD02_006410 [Eretmocerus hayati]|uniref:Uncharacterized protein n=1 Tax=Eretmocerus hayati TaxID=131215 RepID=A0ACC2N0W5_9HYME|nr:hypothetical protein QAD02_006410 [Eretmocerus hayati]
MEDLYARSRSISEDNSPTHHNNHNDADKISEIRMKAKGEAGVKWNESPTMDSYDNDELFSDSYSNHETYFKSCHVLYGDTSGENYTTLGPGDYAFLFRINLPQNIPDSFKHKHGFVRYQLKAVLERPRKAFLKDSRKVVVPFYIKSPHKFILDPSSTVGVNDDIRHHFSCFFSQIAQMVEASVRSNARSFAPGETIVITISRNMATTNVDLNEISMKLKQEILLRATSRAKSSQTTVKKTVSTEPFSDSDEIQLQMKVPDLPPSRLDNCSIIDIQYILVLKFVPTFNSDVIRKYPIEIGMRNPHSCDSEVPEPSAPPIEAAFENLSLATPSDSFQTPNCTADMYTSAGHPDDPPPSYEECVTGFIKEENLRKRLQESDDVLF